MREKKKRTKDDIEDGIVIKYAEPKIMNFNQVLNEIKREESKNYEEEKKGTLKLVHKDTDKDLIITTKSNQLIKENESKEMNSDIISSNYTLKLDNFSTFREDKSDEFNYTDYSKLESYKIELENDLGDMLFANLYQIIDNIVEVDKRTYDESLTRRVKEELFELEDDKLDLCIRRLPDVFNLVIKERVALINGNK